MTAVIVSIAFNKGAMFREILREGVPATGRVTGIDRESQGWEGRVRARIQWSAQGRSSTLTTGWEKGPFPRYPVGSEVDLIIHNGSACFADEAKAVGGGWLLWVGWVFIVGVPALLFRSLGLFRETPVQRNPAQFLACLIAALGVSGSRSAADTAVPAGAPKIRLRADQRTVELSAPHAPREIDFDPYFPGGGDLSVSADQPDFWRIEQCLETSLSFNMEGPHVDLIDWRHGYTVWWQPARDAAGNYRIASEPPFDPAAPRHDPLPFPRVSEREVLAAVPGAGARSEFVRRYLKEYRWDPEHPPAGVSAIILRLSVREGGAWKPARQIRILIPMGC